MVILDRTASQGRVPPKMEEKVEIAVKKWEKKTGKKLKGNIQIATGQSAHDIKFW